MIVVGIDPGTWCGWAVLDGRQHIASGVWDLRPRRHEGGGMRILRFRRYISELLTCGPVASAVAYEEVRRHMGVDAAHIYGAIVGALGSICEERDPKIPYRGIPVRTVKKHATGKGNANKGAMLAAARERWAPHDVVDDNEADALWIADCFAAEMSW